MNGIRSLSIQKGPLSSNLYFISITFDDEFCERYFLYNVAKLFGKQYVMSTLIQDLDCMITCYKGYFSTSEYVIWEHNPSHPFISATSLCLSEMESVIDNFGYYTLDAYIYWSKSKIDFEKALSNKSNYFYMDYSELSIRQVLDLSLEIQVRLNSVGKLLDVAKNMHNSK